ncbi:MAG: ATP phosphoribosyltransferase regulatory subunit [Dehalococcoidia bacterium]
MADLAGDELARMRRVEDAFATAASAMGFQEVRTPLIEYLHLYTMSGTLSPQLLGRVYSFLDWDGWSGERVVLRPDSTVAVARLYGERYGGQRARLFYQQPVLRFAAGGEQRESWQCGAELFGWEAVEAEIELITVAGEVFKLLGLPQPELRISHSGIVRALLEATGQAPAEQVEEYDRILAGDMTVIDLIESRLPGIAGKLRLLFETQGESAAYVQNLRGSLAGDVPAAAVALDELAQAAEKLTKLGMTYRVVTPLARDFEYYTGIVFQLGYQDEIVGAGGRYDQLTRLVGGEPTPACGFAFDTQVVAGLLAKGPAEARVAAEATV